jgi:hypothetical protein
MRRRSLDYLATHIDQLSERDRAILTDLENTRVLTGAQLQRLRFADIATSARARDRRRVLARLTYHGFVSTLDRRIGGVRAGSAGHVYRLTPTARRLLDMQRNQPARLLRTRTPGALFLNHALEISQMYVNLIEASRTNDFCVSTFNTEPACWHPTGNSAYLKPDAYLVLATPTYQDCWWLEIDRATESRHRIKRKIQSYMDHLTTGGTGPDGIPPRILFTTPDTTRSATIRKVITTLATETRADQMVCVTTHADAPQFLVKELAEP